MAVSKLYESFEDVLSGFEKKYQLKFDRIAIAVSGGADSIALALLLKQYSQKYKVKLTTLTVNHHLRKEADAEVLYVAGLMKSWGIEHHVLDWHSGNPKSGIEEKAREARYALLLKWCLDNGYKNLMLGHHQKDQAETFIMRLQRGSGVDGLACMAEVSEREKIKLVRPLLGFSPEVLQDFLKKKKVDWVSDASNECDDFLRVRVRKILLVLEKELGLTTKRLADTAAAMGSVRAYFEIQVKKFLKASTKNWDNFAYSFSIDKLNKLHKEVKIRVLATMIRKIGAKPYPPEFEELNRLCSALESGEFQGCTLGGCEVVVFQENIWIIKEVGKTKPLSQKTWEKYTQEHPRYAKVQIPYKLKINLCFAKKDPI